MTDARSAVRFALRQVNGALPFLYPASKMFAGLRFVRGPLQYAGDYLTFRRAPANGDMPLRMVDTFPCLYDRYEESGTLSRHYFHQDLWAARKVYRSKAEVHYDFGSRIDGFVAHCLVFTTVRLFDIRPLSQPVEGLEFIRTDITDLRAIVDDSVASLSSLHAIEHIGLGRYGDPVEPGAHLRALSELERVLAVGGSLYIGVPIGRERLEFNGHRVFSPSAIPHYLKRLRLEEFAAVDDANRFVPNALPGDFAAADYACGLYHFTKR